MLRSGHYMIYKCDEKSPMQNQEGAKQIESLGKIGLPFEQPKTFATPLRLLHQFCP